MLRLSWPAIFLINTASFTKRVYRMNLWLEGSYTPHLLPGWRQTGLTNQLGPSSTQTFLSIMSTMTNNGPKGRRGLVKLLAEILLFLSTQGLWSLALSEPSSIIELGQPVTETYLHWTMWNTIHSMQLILQWV